MILHRKIVRGLLIGMTALSGSAIGFDDHAAEEKEMTKLDTALLKYVRTGNEKNCLNTTRIRNSRVIDDNHIIFEVRGRKVYLNTLPRKCPTLGFHKAIQYTVRGGAICKNDLFQVFDTTGIRGVGCSFGAFEELNKKAGKDEKKEAVPE